VSRPVPTPLAVAFFAAGLLPAVLSVLTPTFGYVALAVDLAVVALCAVDFALAPKARQMRAWREVDPVLSSGVPNPVQLVVEVERPARGEIRDHPPVEVHSAGHRQEWSASPGSEARLQYRIQPPSRGDLKFGDLHVRVVGPLGLCMRQFHVEAAQPVKVYPDLTALAKDALALARASDAPADRAVRRPDEGREFESLREYRTGDDYRSIDWKSTARKGKTMVRAYQPERDQVVMLLLDCGRHMAGRIAGRRKLDHAVDGALRMAKVCLDKGDRVGVAAFGTEVHTMLPPRKGREHLRTLTEALYRVEATLQESDYGRALDMAFAKQHKRALVVVFTDLLDPDTSAALVRRTRALRPRHLPLVVSLLDEDLAAVATALPMTVQDAYARQTAARLEDEYRLTAAQLRNAGALVVRAPARTLSAAAVNEYLHVKAHGLL
jgi:uncharacterized protein (DUF58 family)